MRVYDIVGLLETINQLLSRRPTLLITGAHGAKRNVRTSACDC